MDYRNSFPEAHIISPLSTHTHTVILLHGRDSNGPEFAQELFQGEFSAEKTLPQYFPGFKWIFPSAHRSYSTVFQEDLVEWFDIYSLTDPSEQEELQIGGLRDSVTVIHGLIADEVKTLGPSHCDRIILGGISQGCATAMTTLLTGPCGIGAFIGFAGWLPLMGCVKEASSKAANYHSEARGRTCKYFTANLRLSLGLEERSPQASSSVPDDPKNFGRDHPHPPIFLGHTADDEIVDIALGTQMRDTLTETGLHDIVWKRYETGGHWLPEPEAFNDLVAFLTQIIGGDDGSTDL